MAFTILPTNLNTGNQVVAFQWANITNGNAGFGYQIPNYADKTVHIFGTFGAGGSVTLYGSNNKADLTLEPGVDAGNTWVPLTDPQANAITKTATSIEAILENTLYICPRVTAGDVTTSITVVINSARNY